MIKLQSILDALYPQQCVLCETQISDQMGLCGPCWRETPFIHDLTCDKCGCPLPGVSDRRETCDDCLITARPWGTGHAALLYKDRARRLVLALKHGDRQDIAKPAAHWMSRFVPSGSDYLIVPIPSHRIRLLKRKFNPAALLAQRLAGLTDGAFLPDALIRTRHTPTQDRKSMRDRFENVHDAIHPHPRNGRALAGRKVLLVDDVMTSGATFANAAEACFAAGADHVNVLALARVVKDA